MGQSTEPTQPILPRADHLGGTIPRFPILPDASLRGAVLELRLCAEILDRAYDQMRQGALFGHHVRLDATAHRIHRAARTVGEISKTLCQLEAFKQGDN